MKHIVITVLFLNSLIASAQFGSEQISWDAQWITVPEIEQTDAGLYLFRKTLNFEVLPDTFSVWVSADNKYKLYVNGQLISYGPSGGDIEHWNYETVDLLPYLQTGSNILAAEVWNEGPLKPVSQFSYRTAFIMQGVGESAEIINSNESWQCIEDQSFTPIEQQVPGYYAAGAGQYTDMNKKISALWKQVDFDDSEWMSAQPLSKDKIIGLGSFQRDSWQLQQSIIPGMELSYERLSKTRKSRGTTVPAEFPSTSTDLEIAPDTDASILLDQDYLTNAFLTLIFSKGKGAVINIRYAESLYGENNNKGNRNEIEGKVFLGRRDSILSNGDNLQEFTTLSYRTYRYVQLDIATKDDPLILNDIYGTFVGYPFEMNANINSGNQEIDKMMEIGWRTARLCAVDTYMDCPFYERLQYVGDTRIQHFVSYYNSGDDRLAKNAINLIDQSRRPDGYTLSRYPDVLDQVIPTYSLWYVSMLYDYMMYGSDSEFVKPKLLGIRQVLNYFITFIDEDGSLKNVPGWNYTDWVPEWRYGIAPVGEDGSSALLDLQLLLALQSAIAMEENIGSTAYAKLYMEYADNLAVTIQKKYWDERKGLYADTPEKEKYSQHANSLALLAGLVNNQDKRSIGEKMLSDSSLAPASIYFKYYLHLALREAGMGDHYLEWLDIWRKNIELGLTTWGEDSQVETTRSDCHAWGSSPNVEFFRIILGIESGAPNFRSVRIQPNLGSIKEISGTMPHPQGEISVSYIRKKNNLDAVIVLPENISGTFLWNGTETQLTGGKNELKNL